MSEKVMVSMRASRSAPTVSMTSTPWCTTRNGRTRRPLPMFTRTSFMWSLTSVMPSSMFSKKLSRLRVLKSATKSSTRCGLSTATSAFSIVSGNPVSKKLMLTCG
nr:MAG: hypothetical protein [Molluscum contagiosum virus]